MFEARSGGRCCPGGEAGEAGGASCGERRGGVRQRIIGTVCRASALRLELGAGGDVVVDGSAEELFELVGRFEAEAGRLSRIFGPRQAACPPQSRGRSPEAAALSEARTWTPPRPAH